MVWRTVPTAQHTFQPSPPCGVHMANRITSTAPTVTLFSACERLRQAPPRYLIFFVILTRKNSRAFLARENPARATHYEVN
jgi:hypothetical protein